MTRINCVDPSMLTDKHLVAEYRELPRVFKLARIAPEAPKQYTLGKGHVLFFYDKLSFCVKRQHKLVDEMIARGFKPKFDPEELWHFHEKAGGTKPDCLWNDWTPNQTAMNVNIKRLKERGMK